MSYNDWKQGREDAQRGIKPGGPKPGESGPAHRDRTNGADSVKNKR